MTLAPGPSGVKLREGCTLRYNPLVFRQEDTDGSYLPIDGALAPLGTGTGPVGSGTSYLEGA